MFGLPATSNGAIVGSHEALLPRNTSEEHSACTKEQSQIGLSTGKVKFPLLSVDDSYNHHTGHITIRYEEMHLLLYAPDIMAHLQRPSLRFINVAIYRCMNVTTNTVPQPDLPYKQVVHRRTACPNLLVLDV